MVEKRRRPWVWLVGLVIIATGAATLVRNGADSNEPEATVEPRLAEAVVTDLVEESTFAGTVGRPAGDPVTAAFGGVVTASPDPGDSVEAGDVLYEIDTNPVVLLYGDAPMYRTLQQWSEHSTVEARRSGTITWLPEEGVELIEGDVIARVDDEPIVLLYGDTPAYRDLRDLRTDMSGPDVLQLEEALVRLGYDSDGDLEVDDTFAGATADAVERMQEALGAEETGALGLGSVVFLPGPITVASVDGTIGSAVAPGQPFLSYPSGDPTEGDDVLLLEQALESLGYGGDLVVDGVFDAATVTAVEALQSATGMAVDGVIDLGEVLMRPDPIRVAERLTPVGGQVNPGGAVLGVTTSDVVVTVDLPAAEQDTLSAGDLVEVELADGTRLGGVVDSVASVATITQGQAIFETIVRLDDPSQVGDLDEAPVDVVFVSDSVSDVLAVPVTALLALREGGYAVEVLLADGSTGLIAVEPGFFADGLVEVASDALVAGAQVVIP